MNDNKAEKNIPWGTPVEKCRIQEALKEEMKKPPHLRNFAFMICCDCLRCRNYMFN